MSSQQNELSPKGNHQFFRAQFDFDSKAKNGSSVDQASKNPLSLKYGDTVAVNGDQMDKEWWEARKLAFNGVTEEKFGVIPSRKLREKTVKMKRKQIEINGSRFPAFIHPVVSLFRSKKDTERLNRPVLSYESVKKVELTYAPPVVILGPLKDKVRNDLINDMDTEDSTQFTTCIQHTSREQKETEGDGVNYHFVSKEDMEEDKKNGRLIGAQEYYDNIYATKIDTICSAASQGKHCVLDIDVHGIIQLHKNNLYPIVILIRPKDITMLKAWIPTLSEEDAQKEYEKLDAPEIELAQFVTAIAEGQNAEEVSARVRHIICIITDQSKNVMWIPIPKKPPHA